MISVVSHLRDFEWLELELNQWQSDFQSDALPTELSSLKYSSKVIFLDFSKKWNSLWQLEQRITHFFNSFSKPSKLEDFTNLLILSIFQIRQCDDNLIHKISFLHISNSPIPYIFQHKKYFVLFDLKQFVRLPFFCLNFLDNVVFLEVSNILYTKNVFCFEIYFST